MSALGAVVIGRNEGARLDRCLRSLIGSAHVVYVDSGSTDGSQALADRLKVELVKLDMSKPFTAARARNAGFGRLIELHAQTRYVMFVDGDCEVVEGWLPKAQARLEAADRTAVVCGRRRERRPEASVYNALCDLEWDSPVGEAKSCGGDAMMRVEAFSQVGGYRDELIAGEEPELCVRLRGAGWKIERLDAEMTLHDADMTRFSQWWRRAMRAGHAFAEGAHLHGAPPECHLVKESKRALVYGGVVPALAFTAAPITLGGQPVLALRVPIHRLACVSTRQAQGLGLQKLRVVLGLLHPVQIPRNAGCVAVSRRSLRRQEIQDHRIQVAGLFTRQDRSWH